MSDSTNDAGDKKSWFGRLAGGLKRSSSSLGAAIVDLVTKGPMDPAKLDMIQDALVRADLGYDLAHRVTKVISQGRLQPGHHLRRGQGGGRGRSRENPRAGGQASGDRRRQAVRHPGGGVNGSGKTTTIGKLASKLAAEGRKVVLAAGDTFRAAAIDQLKIWGQRTGARVGGERAGLRFRKSCLRGAECRPSPKVPTS
jgi:fused signal recognition particle receptor